MPQSTDLRTCDLEIPRGHATIKCKKYFEVRYYLNVIVGTTHMNVVTVQLPIILIHINSLDVPTNSVAQVAAAIEEKRGQQKIRGTTPIGRGRSDTHYSPRIARHQSRNQIQGRAFSAPRKASSERQRWLREHREHQNMAGMHSNHSSPRARQSLATDRNKEKIAAAAPMLRHENSSPYLQIDPSLYRGGSFSFRTPPSNRKGRLILDNDADELRRRFGHVRNSLSLGTTVSITRTNRSASTVLPRASSALGRPSFTTATSSAGKPLLSVRSLNFTRPPNNVERKMQRPKPRRPLKS